jgi:hypothetical protein
MTSVGSVADIVQLPDAEISTDNATSSYKAMDVTRDGNGVILRGKEIRFHL